MEQVENGGIHPGDYLTILKRRWLIASVVFVTVVSAAAYGTWKLPPVYEAVTKVTFQPAVSSLALPERRSPYESILLHNLSFETQAHIIASEPVIRRIAESLDLLDAEMSADEESEILGAVHRALSVKHIDNTSILQIKASHTAPEMTARLANAAAEVYVQLETEREAEATRYSRAWLTQTLLDVSRRLEAADHDWIQYARERQMPLEMISESDTASTPPNATLMRAARDELELKQAELRELRKRYLPGHPRVAALQREIGTLEAEIDSVEGSLIQTNSDLLELSALRSKAEVTRSLRDLLVRRITESTFTGGMAESTVQVIEAAAVPRAPVRPNRMRNLALGVTAAVFLAFAFALLAEYMDRSVNSPEQIERTLGLPTLAVLGRVRGSRATAPMPFLMGQESSFRRESEAFRTLRTNLRFSYAGEERKILLVTSGGPGEGKTTVAMNLGLAIAQTNQRVLLVDADFRQPALHKVFQVRSNTGLADVLSGDVTLEQAIMPIAPGVDLLPRGTRPPNPSELLDSRRMREVLAEVREQYDSVVVDSPPIGTVVDPSVLAPQTEGIVLVVESGRFRPEYLQRLVKRIDRIGGKIYGVVMNKVHANDSLYGDYYYYAPYYTDEPAEAGAESRG